MTDDVLDHATRALTEGSRSFAAATTLFTRRTRDSVTLLYAWCRYCDDRIDGQELGGAMVPPAASLATIAVLEAATRDAYGTGPLPHPAFAGLRRVAGTHLLPMHYPIAHLDGFRMDVEGRRYDRIEDLLQYCYHVAGVVGLMMASVMGVRDPAVLDRACDLGVAFQLTNIARDVIDDAQSGRVYLPLDWLADAGLSPDGLAAAPRPALAQVVQRLLQTAEPYYASAACGTALLPHRSAWAVATAQAVYRDIGMEVLRRGPAAWDQRVFTSRARKLRLMLRAGITVLARSPRQGCRQSLWTRPSFSDCL